MKVPTIYDLHELLPDTDCPSRTYRQQMQNQQYIPARPDGRGGLWTRVRAAWLVFTGAADAVIWPDSQQDASMPHN